MCPVVVRTTTTLIHTVTRWRLFVCLFCFVLFCFVYIYIYTPFTKAKTLFKAVLLSPRFKIVSFIEGA